MKELISNDPTLSQMLQDPNLNPIQKQYMLQQVASYVNQRLGYDTNDIKLISSNETGANGKPVKGYYDPQTQINFINDINNNSTKDFISTLGHEMTHLQDYQNGIFIPRDQDQNKYATNFGNNLASYTNKALYITNGGSLANTNNHNNFTQNEDQSVVFNNTNNIINQNNYLFSQADKSIGDDKVSVFSRPVLGVGPNHLYITVTERENNKPDMIMSLGAGSYFNKVFGGTPTVEIKPINSTENKGSTLQDDTNTYLNNTYKQTQVVDVPKGMTQYQFDEAVIVNAQEYDYKTNQYPNIIDNMRGTKGSVNSNSFVNSVIENSGGELNKFDGAVLQKNKPKEFDYSSGFRDNAYIGSFR